MINGGQKIKVTAVCERKSEFMAEDFSEVFDSFVQILLWTTTPTVKITRPRTANMMASGVSKSGLSSTVKNFILFLLTLKKESRIFDFSILKKMCKASLVEEEQQLILSWVETKEETEAQIKLFLKIFERENLLNRQHAIINLSLLKTLMNIQIF